MFIDIYNKFSCKNMKFINKYKKTVCKYLIWLEFQIPAVRAFCQTAWGYEINKQDPLVVEGDLGWWSYPETLPLCVVYIFPQHSNIFASEAETNFLLYHALGYLKNDNKQRKL